MHAAVASVTGDLKIQVTRRFLVGQHTVVIPLVLVLVQIGGISSGRLAGRTRIRGCAVCQYVGNLIRAVRRTSQEADAAGVIQDVGQIREPLVLFRVIVGRNRTVDWV